MDCKAIEQTLSQKTLAELTDDERTAMEQHLADCADCRQKWDPALQSQELHRSVKELGRTTTVKDSVMSRIRGKESDAPSDGAEPVVPERIAGFEVVGTLGRGGMGTVLKARQVSMDRFVALKVLPQALAKDEDFVKRFIREAHAAARLRHPHIVQGYDAGLADDYYYFAMEYVDGEGLDAVVAREGPLEPARALRVMKQACSALWAAHEAGIVHRDIKPSNLMLDSKDEVRVTDFGLAKHVDAEVLGAPRTGRREVTATAAGQALGTPAYLAPEVAKGQPADARSDLYSLGATFFHVLTGRPPFEARQLTQVVLKQINEPPPPLASVMPDIDPRLCRVIDRLLRKELRERYESAQELLGQLEAIGPLQSAAELARAEGRAMIRDAPTVPLPSGKRLELEAALDAHGPLRSRRTRLIAAAALGAAGILAMVLWPGGGPQQGGRVSVRDPASKEPPARHPREQEAEDLLRDAEDMALMMQWVDAKNHLKKLDEKYSDTAFYKEQIVAIGKLRAEIGAALNATVEDPKPPPGVEPVEPREPPGEWVALFDDETLKGWRVVDRFQVEAAHGDGKGGEVRVEDGAIVFEPGRPATGIARAAEFPTEGYEVVLEVMNTSKPETFGIVFPIGRAHCLLTAGGWQGTVVGLTAVDGRWGNDNPTTHHMQFPRNEWYRVRVRVTEPKVQVWIGTRRVIDLARAGHRFEIPSDREPLLPFGFETWSQSAKVRSIAMRRVRQPDEERPEAPQLPDRPGQWVSLFDGISLRGWKASEGGDYGGHGPVTLKEGRLLIASGKRRTGVMWTGDFPTVDYEVVYRVLREAGVESCELLFPAGSSRGVLVVASRLRDTFGLTTVDGRAARLNDTGRSIEVRDMKWVDARVRVTRDKIEAWLDDRQIVDFARAGRRFTSRTHQAFIPSFGLASWRTTWALQKVAVKLLERQPEPVPDGVEVATAAVAVSARDGWADAGLHLTKGKPIRIAAAGRWGALPGSSCGPAGVPHNSRSAHPLAGKWMHCLIGRVGDQGAPFRIGDALAFTPSRSGRLWLRMSDRVMEDNWGSLRVEVHGALTAVKGAPLLGGFAKETARIKVRPGAGWVATGVKLARGDAALLSAEGFWEGGPELGQVTADGVDKKVRELRDGILLGRIGERGAVFPVGSLHLLEAAEAGTLYLGIHTDPIGPARGGRLEPLGGPLEREALLRPRGGAERAQPAGELTVSIRTAGPLGPAPKGGMQWRLAATLRGHSGWVMSVAFSPDGTRIASGGKDRAVRLWDAATGACTQTMRDHFGTVESVVFCPGGEKLLSASRDRTLRLWDASTGQSLKVFAGHEEPVRSVVVLPDGARAVSTGEDNTLRVWDMATGRCVSTLHCTAHAWGLAVSRDGKRVAAADDVGWLRLADPQTGRLERTFFARSKDCWAVAFSPDGAQLASAGNDPVLHVWDAATGKCLRTVPTDGMVRSVAFSPDGRHIAAGGWYRAVHFWDAASGEHVRSLEAHSDEVRDMAFSPDGQRLATASFDGSIKVWALTAAAAGEPKPPAAEPKPAAAERKPPAPMADLPLAPEPMVPPAREAAVPTAWGKTVNGLRCSLVLSPAELRVGHAYVFDVVVENVSDKATHFHFSPASSSQRLVIKTPGGDEVPRLPMMGDHRLRRSKALYHLIKPGERFTTRLLGRVSCQFVQAANLPADRAGRKLLLGGRGAGHQVDGPGRFTAHIRIAADDRIVAEGKHYGVEPVWAGTLESNAVALSVRWMTAEELDAALRAVTDGTPKEQSEAIKVLAASAERKAAPVLLGVLAKGPGPLHRDAASGLGRIQDTSVIPDLLALYKRFAGRGDPVNGEFTRNVLDAWHTLEPDEGKRAAFLIQVLGSAAAVETRGSAAWRLVHLKHPQRVPALLAAARSGEPRMQWAAIDALGSLTRRDPGETDAQIAEGLVAILKGDPERTVRSRAASALGRIDHETVVPALVAALKDPNHFVGAAAAHSLALRGGPEVIPALEAFAKTAEKDSQADAARRAIESIKRRHP